MHQDLLPALAISTLAISVAAPLKHFRVWLIWLATALVFSAGFVDTVLPVRILLIPPLVALCITGCAGPRIKVLGLVLGVAGILAQWTGSSASTAEETTRILFVLPLALCAGAGFDDRDRGRLGVAMVWLGSVSSVAALLEWKLSRWFLPNFLSGEPLFRDGHVRAVVAAEHPLTLAATLVACVPMAMALRCDYRLRILTVLLLSGGVFATGSRGALGVIVIVAIVRLLVSRRTRARTFGNVVLAYGLVLALVGALYFALTANSQLGSVVSRDSSQASVEYRPVLYRAAEQSLFHRPFGYGLGGLPRGTYQIPSSFGVLDLSDTVDSEYVLLIFSFGILGLLFAGWAWWRILSHSGWRQPCNQAAASILVCGAFLALHAWIGLGGLLFLLLGASGVSTRRGEFNGVDAGARSVPGDAYSYSQVV